MEVMKPVQRPNFYRRKHDGRRVSIWDFADGSIGWMLDPLPVIAPRCAGDCDPSTFDRDYILIPARPLPSPADEAVAMAVSDGWLYHGGGACPVHPDDKVHFRTLPELTDRNSGHISEDADGREAASLRWEWKGFLPIEEDRNDNIVVYRVVTPHQ
jgi:hypothetical protein